PPAARRSTRRDRRRRRVARSRSRWCARRRGCRSRRCRLRAARSRRGSASGPPSAAWTRRACAAVAWPRGACPRADRPGAARTHLGLPADEAAVLHASNTLTLRVLPADVVARIAPRDRTGDLAVELERAEALQAVGAPVGPPDPRLAPTVHVCDEHAITLWQHLPARDRPELPPAEFAAALAALHAGMRALDQPVAPLSDRVGHALDLLRDPERTPTLVPADRALLQETLA